MSIPGSPFTLILPLSGSNPVIPSTSNAFSTVFQFVPPSVEEETPTNISLNGDTSVTPAQHVNIVPWEFTALSPPAHLLDGLFICMGWLQVVISESTYDNITGYGGANFTQLAYVLP